jgi:two-component system NtrC family sensor kinase
MYEIDPSGKTAFYVGSVGVIRDITDRKRMEAELKHAYEDMEITVQRRTRELQAAQAQLIQSEKMTALGTMVAGVAHELNNPLMGVINFIQYCRKHTPEEDKRAAVLESAEKETNRSIGIVKNLLTFARGQNSEHVSESEMQYELVINIFDRVERLLLYRIEKEGITLTKNIDESIPEIPMRTEEIQQVFLNIMVNALDALKSAEAEKCLNVSFFLDGDYVCTQIFDSGCGISEEDMVRIFDPFFTTKPVGEGTGLGLSISRNIVKEHGGSITCESVQGVGTTVKISLPVR